MLAVTSKLKQTVASCAAQQEQARLQFDALQQQWEGAGGAVEALRAEDRRLKRHVARLERKAEVCVCVCVCVSRRGWASGWVGQRG